MILFLDDEASADDFYLTELREKGLPVTPMRNLKAAWQFLVDTPGVRAIVLDIMMPPHDTFDLTETRHGLLTGVSFYRQLRARFPSMPVFVLTNNTDPAIAAALQGDPNADLSEKTNLWADDFAEKVARTYASREAIKEA